MIWTVLVINCLFIYSYNVLCLVFFTHFNFRFREFPKCVLIVLRNATFMFLSLANVTNGLVWGGLTQFLPKVMQSLFMFTTSFTAILFGKLHYIMYVTQL